MDEIYKDVPGFPGYSVSNFGNVMGRSGRVLKPLNTTGGYCRVDLCGPDGVKHHKIHRLVATLFIDNPEEKEEIDHIDGNLSNNHVSNLRWATRAENLANRKIFTSKKTKLPKGVFAQDGKFRARIKINRKTLSLGTFETIELAATVYAEFARKHYGEFAKL